VIRLTEAVIDELIEVLEDDLPARITAIAAVEPTLTMKPIAEITHGEKQNYAMPAIAITPVTSPLRHDGQDELLWRHNIGVLIHATHADQETLTRLLERYAAAVIQTLMDRRAAQTISFPFQLSTEDGAEFDWGVAMAAERSLFARDVMFVVIATVDDERT